MGPSHTLRVMAGAPLFEKVVGFLTLPLLQRAIYKLMGCGKKDAKEISFSKITGIFSKVRYIFASASFMSFHGVESDYLQVDGALADGTLIFACFTSFLGV